MINHSGIGRYIKTLLPLIDGHFKICAIGDQNELRQYISRGDIFPCAYSIYSFKEQFLMSRAIPMSRIYWCPHFNLPLFQPKADKMIVTIHDTYHLTHSKGLPGFKRLTQSILYENAAKKSAHIFTVSQFSKHEIEKHLGKYSEHKVEVIPNSLNPSQFSEISTAVVPDKKYVLYVGNQRANKGLNTLIEAFSSLPDGLNKKFQLKLVGTPNPELRERVSRLKIDNIKFAGFVDDRDLHQYYRQADLFCMPSDYEGFGYPVLEALAHGIPVLCSNIPAFKEHFSDYVRFFEVNNSNDLRTQMIKALSVVDKHCVKFPLNIHFEHFNKQYLSRLNQLLP